MLKTLLALLATSVLSLPAYAFEYTVTKKAFRENNKTVTGLSAHGSGNRGYFRINGAPEGNCGSSIIVFEHGTTFGDAAYELLQTALANNLTLARIDYIEEEPGGHCLLTVLEVK